MKRKKTIPVKIGKITIGGENPILIQSMTNTDTSDVTATITQIKKLIEAGSELVRVTVNDENAAKAIPKIVNCLREEGYEIPIIGDFHYNGHILLEKFPECAKSLDKYRINPGNVYMKEGHDNNFKAFIDIAKKHDKPVRIGVNSGSLDENLLQRLMEENSKSENPKSAKEVFNEALVQSALQSAKKAEEYGLPKDKIVLSVKTSDMNDFIKTNKRLAEMCDYALHVGLTEAGMGEKGAVASTTALGILLYEGIGDTIRISITPKPRESRTKEVQLCQLLLQSMNIRNFISSANC